MTGNMHSNDEQVEQKPTHKKLVSRLVLIVVLMFGFGYALVPMYDVLCKLVGQNTKIESSVETPAEFTVDESREIKVEFITSLNEKTPLTFHAAVNSIVIHPGQYYTVNFYAKNNTSMEIKAQAIPSITPGLAEEFFKKTQCFCFTTQTFKPNEEKIMPVRFVVNPKIPDSYKIITLSYTFFDRTNIIEN